MNRTPPCGDDRPAQTRSSRLAPVACNPGGTLWGADRYFLGGNLLVRSRRVPISGTVDSAFYLSERWGHFTYAIPVPQGRYRVTLKFSENHWSDADVGRRLFDIFFNGVALLRNFDIVKEAYAARTILHL